MPAPQHQRDRGLLHAGDELRNGQSRLNISAHRIEQDQKTVDVVALLHRRQKGQHMFVLGGLDRRVQRLMALDLSYDGQRVDGSPPGADDRRTQLFDLPFLRPLVLLCFHTSSCLLYTSRCV